MVGADEDPQQLPAWSVIKALGMEPILVGPVGQAAAIKLALNQLVAALTVRLCFCPAFVCIPNADQAKAGHIACFRFSHVSLQVLRNRLHARRAESHVCMPLHDPGAQFLELGVRPATGFIHCLFQLPSQLLSEFSCNARNTPGQNCPPPPPPPQVFFVFKLVHMDEKLAFAELLNLWPLFRCVRLATAYVDSTADLQIDPARMTYLQHP